MKFTRRRNGPSIDDGLPALICGAAGGAPKGNKNALKHGKFTAEAIETRRMVARLTKQARHLVEAL